MPADDLARRTHLLADPPRPRPVGLASAWASTSSPGSRPGTGSAWCSRPRPAPASPRRSPCPARCSSWARAGRRAGPRRWGLGRPSGPTGATSSGDQPAAHRPAARRPQPSPLPAGSERVAVDRAAFDRARVDRAAFDRAGFGRTADDVRVDRAGIDRAAADGAGPDHADDSGADVRSLIPGPRMPLPSETSGLGQRGAGGRAVAPSWTGWRAGTDPARTGSAGADTRPDRADGDDRARRPSRRGPPAGDAPTAGAASAARPTLRRRVPQAHLAPGLRIVTSAAEPADPAPLPVAAEALSRYQASRAAARSAVDGQVANEAADERSSG